MKEEIGTGYFRLDVQSEGDKKQIDRIVQQFTKAVDAALKTNPNPVIDDKSTFFKL